MSMESILAECKNPVTDGGGNGDDEDDHKKMSASDAGRRYQHQHQNNEERWWWCYMMVNFMPDQKINTFICESQHPNTTVDEHNHGNVKGSKSTKSAAGNWILDMIIGPFDTRQDSMEFAKTWRKNSRGIPSRKRRGRDLAKESNKTCWDRDFDVKQQQVPKIPAPAPAPASASASASASAPASASTSTSALALASPSISTSEAMKTGGRG